MAAARETMAESGLEALTLAVVAARAGVAVGTVYNRFEDKQHLVHEVVREWTEEVSDAFLAERSGPLGADTLEERLRKLVLLYREHRTLLRQFLIHAPFDDRMSSIVDPWFARERAHLIADLAAVDASHDSSSNPGGAVTDRCELVATMILATLERAVVADVQETAWEKLERELPDVVHAAARADRRGGPERQRHPRAGNS